MKAAMEKVTQVEIDALYLELDTTFETTLTEARYNQIMDVLLPSLEKFPDARATLRRFGKLEWRERRVARERPVRAA